MAIYLENEDGSLTLIKADKTINEVAEEAKEELVALGLEPSTCVKDLLDLPKPTSKVKPSTQSDIEV
jgi:hypothetical protein